VFLRVNVCMCMIVCMNMGVFLVSEFVCLSAFLSGFCCFSFTLGVVVRCGMLIYTVSIRCFSTELLLHRSSCERLQMSTRACGL
jgi:hypothetical protein